MTSNNVTYVTYGCYMIVPYVTKSIQQVTFMFYISFLKVESALLFRIATIKERVLPYITK